MRLIRLLALLLAFSLAPFATAQPTLETLLEAPYVESLKASPDGDQLAWVVNQGGARNIGYTTTGEISPIILTTYTEDDGLGIALVGIAQGYILYLRGNGNNRQGYPANPASLATTPERQLLRLRIADGAIDTLAATGNATLGPQGRRLVYAKGNQVYEIPDVSEETPQPRVGFEVRSGAGSFAFSPDGERLAFTSRRQDHSYVGVYRWGARHIAWMAPGLAFDDAPAWSPDGKQLAFIRQPGYSKDGLRNLMGGTPFEIVVAEVATGKGSTKWKSPADDGGYAQYYPNAPLRWTSSGHLVFYSEHEGWNHIYAMRPDGTGLRDLSPGACETENSALSADGQTLYFTSNCGDLNRRHIWAVALGSGSARQLSENEGIQTNPEALAGGALAYREGRYNQPTTAVLQKGNSRETLQPLPAAFPRNALQEPQAVTFTAADGLTIHGQLFLPPNAGRRQYPAVIFMHGGPIRQMLLGYHNRGYYANAYSMNQYLAAQGYVVLSVNYRAGIGYGRDFRRAKNQGPRGAAEYKDILAGAAFLQQHASVDPQRIGLWGGSYGGYLTAMGLAKNSDLFKAGVDLHGVHDWAWRGRDFSPGGGWGIGADLMEQAFHSSPISELQYWKSPVLIISGDDDRNVMIGQSIDLKNKLDALGVYNEVLVFPDEVHGFLRSGSWLEAYRAAADFFDRHLKGD
ncbi:prolyl oligopeptidase family serine peptidase [Robiginitalea sp. M366]|uniref:S9 family peptidase n=1 Tax=Robiginitalea aestuariiviva TaxID=3036903 RepID=UPI00240E57B8|nr:prolyl oligopeptidase family serine peptidase [Robiginitalea aestuariiviva]MDG1573461.1 prolyl oligopeptidase family serine peptidase [Robiginitalea aestuariiviva]